MMQHKVTRDESELNTTVMVRPKNKYHWSDLYSRINNGIIVLTEECSLDLTCGKPTTFELVEKDERYKIVTSPVVDYYINEEDKLVVETVNSIYVFTIANMKRRNSNG